MKTRTVFFPVWILGVMLVVLAACGDGSVAISDVPIYPGSVELKPGENDFGDTLTQNMQQDASLRQVIGAGGKIEQKGFQLPAEVTWDQVKGFYAKELESKGWASGLGGIAGGFVDVNKMLETANQGNGLFQTAIWSKDKQTLAVVMVASPTGQNTKELLLSLSSQ